MCKVPIKPVTVYTYEHTNGMGLLLVVAVCDWFYWCIWWVFFGVLGVENSAVSCLYMRKADGILTAFDDTVRFVRGVLMLLCRAGSDF
jgi:hypothetical protein